MILNASLCLLAVSLALKLRACVLNRHAHEVEMVERERLAAEFVAACEQRLERDRAALVQRYEVEGVELRRVADLPREEIRVPPEEWSNGLRIYMAFHNDEARA